MTFYPTSHLTPIRNNENTRSSRPRRIGNRLCLDNLGPTDKHAPAPAAPATQEEDTVDPQLAQLIRLLAVKFDEAFNNGDAAALATFYTEDAVYTTADGATYNGRKAIEYKYGLEFKNAFVVQQRLFCFVYAY
jgi:hypothetical protein